MHIHISFMTVYRYNCSILSIVVVVNLFLCLIYKVRFIVGMYVQEKNVVSLRFRTVCGFRHPLGVLNVSLVNKGKMLFYVGYSVSFAFTYKF